jgi:uncharacterized protein (TIGR00730 family)
VYLERTRQLADALVSAGLGLVYGGAHVGLMGALADGVLAGGEVIGVIPEAMMAKEIAHGGLTELRVVPSMHERKALMAELADGFIALPGGLGTLEELFEVLTWAQLGMHGKPCGLLEVDGFFAPLLTFLDHAVEQRFLRPEHRAMLLVDEDAGRLLEQFAAYRPASVAKWIDRTAT